MLNIIMQAQGAAGQQPSLFGAIFPFILIGLVFYFLLIRPQNKRMKQHRDMLAAVTRGDTVVTSGGLIGKVTKVSEGELTVDLGNNLKVKVVSTMIADVRNKTVAANDSGKKK
ncbi:MAG: preprotein translocase subunit YajC [Acidimicrobiales bacterium]|nr:preprotein translocase subunit YajC [Hyphomonadaceae bacterium]RZV42856.1 MAG: preprotein translocase subunit YajC [Acidimicrobiales bacterium]